jgi:hypothetical protein
MTKENVMTPADPVPDATRTAPPARDRSLRRGLWIALVLGVVANLITVLTVEDPVYSSGAGGFVLLCAAALGVLALRRGRDQGGAA